MGGMTYNDYHARIEYDSRDRIFVGHLVGIDAIVGFHGATADELERAFQESVDDYIELSRKSGHDRQKPYSG